MEAKNNCLLDIIRFALLLRPKNSYNIIQKILSLINNVFVNMQQRVFRMDIGYMRVSTEEDSQTTDLQKSYFNQNRERPAQYF